MKRIQIVEGLNRSTLYDLLDKLLGEHIINDGEAEEVKEGNTVTKDKARCLTKLITKKGEQACQTFFTFLQEVDPKLYENVMQ